MFFLGPRPGRGSRVGHFWRDSLGGRGVYDPITARRAPTKDHQRRLADNMYWLPVDRRRDGRKSRDARRSGIDENVTIHESVQQKQQQQVAAVGY